MPSINNFLEGFSNGLPGMKDYRHATRLYLDSNFKLAPKQKFLFHVVFDIDNTTIGGRQFSQDERFALNMLVKSCELPKYDMNLEEKIQYNKKVYVGTRIVYRPVTINFHDDNADTVNAFWKRYYEYNIADSQTIPVGGQYTYTKDDFYNTNRVATQYGMDNAQQRGKPLLRSIQIFALHQKRFTSFLLVNPVIGSFSHDNLDNADGAGIMSNSMQVFYETVLYGAGTVKSNLGPKGAGFSQLYYDLEPSPLSVLGGGTTSIFGEGGIIDGIGGVLDSVQNGDVLGAIIKANNTYQNAKKIKAKDAVKEELKGIVKETVQEVAKTAGTVNNPIGNYSVGAAAVAAVGTIALAKGNTSTTSANSTQTVISNPVIDTTNYLSSTESFNLLKDNTIAQDKIASFIYYQRIGSAQNLTIAQSDVVYAGLTTEQKNVWRARAINDVARLVTEGFIKINRQTNDISISAEKVNL
jgi:hypothetical protein